MPSNSATSGPLLRVLGVALAALLSGCAERPSAPPNAKPVEYRVIDLMPRYWAFRDSTRTASTEQRVQAFKSMVMAAEQRFYDQVLEAPDDGRIGRFLTQMEPLDSVMPRIVGEYLATIPVSWDKLRRLFGDSVSGARIFILPSVFTSNGQVRYLDDSMVVMLGPDVQAYVEVVIDSGRRIAPELDIDHELAHYHHWRGNGEIAESAKSFFKAGAYSQLYYNLWSEGFATYVTRKLNPDAPLDRVLGPGLNPADGPRLVPALAREFLAKLDSRSEDDIRDLFYLSGRRKDIPARPAYYIGLLVVEQMAKQHSFAELAALGGPKLREEMSAALTGLAANGVPTTR